MSNFHHRQTIRAKKQHKCEECRGFILIGEPYVKHSGSNNGDFYSYKLDPICDRIISEVVSATDHYDQDNLVIGEIYQAFEYHDQEQEWLEDYVKNMQARSTIVWPHLIARLEKLNSIKDE